MRSSTTDDVSAKNRLESFKLGKGLPSTLPAKHKHSRSHSRNASISSSFSFPSSASTSTSKPTTVNDISHFSFPPSNSLSTTIIPATVSPNPAPSTKRNSHHRRRSSVSTRHESAELMGVSLPELPPSTSEDNINLGEKDSIRRRALWALEGKPDVSYSKVEIPELSTPDMEKMMFDFSTKPSFSQSSNPGYGSGLNSLMAGKRDSFKLLAASSSSKDQLHTLVEEEEEEEEESKFSDPPKVEDSLPSPPSSIKENVPPQNTPTPVVAVTKSTPRPRPATLNLRPLSLTPENLSSTAQGLPTPSLTPSPRIGLRSFSLTPTPPDELSSENDVQPIAKRNPLAISPTPNCRRPVLNLQLGHFESASITSTPEEECKPARRSSISYKRSSVHGGCTTNIAGLPTPEMTPTFGRRYSNAESLSMTSVDDDFFPSQSRPLSASEQHFLFKSHNALLARITDLERALTSRRRESGFSSHSGSSSRPISVVSNSSVDGVFSEPSDEMLQLLADLKAERDELKRDVDGWRTRVSDLEAQLGTVAKRVENERREAWVARSRVGLLEVEKDVLTKRLAGVDQLIGLHERENTLWEGERKSLRKENEELNKVVGGLKVELESVKKELEMERAKHGDVDPLATPTPRSFESFARPLIMDLPKKHALGFMSVDSESSSTDVDPDSSDDGVHQHFALKAVEEGSGEEDYFDDDSGLAGYEDEEDSDVSLNSSSSFGSEDDPPRSISHLQRTSAHSQPTTQLASQVFSAPRPTHVSRASLSKKWTFPIGVQAQASAPKGDSADSVDRFFECLADVDSDATGSVPNSPSAYSYEKSKGLFANGFKFASEDDNASFFLPSGVGILVQDEEQDGRRLSIVEEEVGEEWGDDIENKDDDDMFGEIGGIRITFTPPQEDQVVEEKLQIQVSPTKRTSPPPTLPALDFGEDGESDDEEELRTVAPFNFGRPLTDEHLPGPPLAPVPAPVSVPPVATLPSSIPRPASPSMIPRPASPSFIPLVALSKSAGPSTKSTSSTPPKFALAQSIAPSSPSCAYITPPTKRGGALPSFIPQPISSPSPIRTAPAPGSRPKILPQSTFIRQPSRKPLLPSGALKNQNGTTGSSNVPSVNNAMNSPRRSSDDHAACPTSSSRCNGHISSPQMMTSVDLSQSSSGTASQYRLPSTYSNVPRASLSSSAPSSSISSTISSPITSRLSFQTFTNLIPMSWAGRAPVLVSTPDVFTHSAASSEHAIAAEPTQIPKKALGFVSRERQLKMLKSRMEVEGVVAMRGAVDVQCKNCGGVSVLI